jgi:hypothetical protein
LPRHFSDATVRAFRVAMRMPIPSRELTFDWRGVRFRIVDAAGAGVARWLPAGDARQQTGTADVGYVVEPWEPTWGARAGRYRVSRDGRLRYLGSRVERLVEWLRADVDAQASRRSAGGLRVRADAVVWRARAILLLRPGRIGTSTLAAALLRRGAGRGVAGIAVIDDAGRVHGEGGPTPIAMVVATTYRPRLAWQSRTAQGALAVLPIIDSAVACGGPLEVLRRAARLAPGLVTLQGLRGEAVDAAPRILAALDERLDADPAAPAPTAAEPWWLARARAAAAARGAALAAQAHEVA